ncbi:ABC transporter ATP-binding protein [Streptococcus pluranimalium]|uniref:Bacteriocin ABC transporter ATP-binding protein n=1 Tax=Streptococcus pluranimalium TaxID=82348 RepID=A0A2L0D613_9STRE|nr:ABC transporter ATP-binding protein [Streptococcus pluranimalium]AUW97237.1 bacteriocin ABC transporter ATP-binding protein [Streptococcus pluranimalium]
MISIINLYKKIGNKEVFNNFSLNISKGEFVALVGPSGSGKTTLLNIIGLIDDEFSGTYSFGGNENIKINSRMSQKIIREEISYLFQNFALIDNETVRYNLLLALKYVNCSKKEKIYKIKAVLAKLGLEEKLDSKVSELSGGEQQRIAVARVFLKPSSLVLADEPTGSLDKTNRDSIIQLLKKMNQNGKTIVIVTHDLEVANECDRIINIKI